MEIEKQQYNQLTMEEVEAEAQSFALTYLRIDGHQRLVFQLSPIRPEVSKWELTESRQTILKRLFPLKIIGFFTIGTAITTYLPMIRITLLTLQSLLMAENHIQS